LSLLRIRDLTICYPAAAGTVKVVDGLDLEIAPGEILGLVGESGSGKTQTALAVLGLLDDRAICSGSVLFDGSDLIAEPSHLKNLRGHALGMIFQDPVASLNPCRNIVSQMMEPLLARGETREHARRLCSEQLAAVHIEDVDRVFGCYPHQLSGGMCQRVMIAMALLGEPRLLVADEACTALDVTVQSQILVLLKELSDTRDMAIMFISHDLGVVAGLADRVTVLYAGREMESAAVAELFQSPLHPYTRGLLACRPGPIDGATDEWLKPIPGQPPIPGEIKQGCPFEPRCGQRMQQCADKTPQRKNVGHGHTKACHLESPA
jgi:oligopeptide/dipeptide ABC transporter ATP-binding protein